MYVQLTGFFDLERDNMIELDITGAPKIIMVDQRHISAFGDQTGGSDYLNPYAWIYEFSVCVDMAYTQPTMTETNISSG